MLFKVAKRGGFLIHFTLIPARPRGEFGDQWRGGERSLQSEKEEERILPRTMGLREWEEFYSSGSP